MLLCLFPLDHNKDTILIGVANFTGDYYEILDHTIQLDRFDYFLYLIISIV
jgi:hypothetical protein